MSNVPVYQWQPTTAEIAAGFDKIELITTENRGLSSARNTGMDAARGKYIVYTDDDAYPDPQWLKYLAIDFEKHGYAALGGPNIGPPEDADLAECVANAPGGPVQVLVDDRIAFNMELARRPSQPQAEKAAEQSDRSDGGYKTHVRDSPGR